MATQKPGPLARLGERLLATAPPRLQSVVEWLAQYGPYLDFVALVRECLPDQEQEILRNPDIGVRIAAFANHFRDRYFPLPWWLDDGEDEEGYEDLTRGLPVVSRGIGLEEYDNLTDWASSYQVAAVLSANPHDTGARIALLESCAQWLPKELLARTGEGYSPAALHERLDRTRYAPAALMADWLNGDTGNAFLDLDEETAREVWEPWDRATVDYLTRQWQQADLIDNRIREFGEWLLKEPAGRFSRMLNVIEGREELNPPEDPRQMRLPGPDFQPVETR
ncbi:MAG: hypothetical protein Q8P22_14040 [Chloroflexota bacterium]|nr:hypothetical protein [Chloroflexota bacterium]